MSDRVELSEAKRTLLEKLTGDIPQAARVGTQHVKAEVAGSRARAVKISGGGIKTAFLLFTWASER